MTASSSLRVYKILAPADRTVADRLGFTQTALDEGDGYVHLSTRDQVGETLRLHYAGQGGVHLLEFDTADLGEAVRWEASRGGDLFPHLYDRLRLTLAKRQWVLSLDAGGTPQLPGDIDT